MAATMKRFQIRDETSGIAIYEAATARDALADFMADQARAANMQSIEIHAGGDATVTVGDQTFRAVAA